MNANVIGISTDTEQSHKQFASKYQLNFPLLADQYADTAKVYGAAWVFGPFKFAKRHSFIINPEGRLTKVYRKVNPKQHANTVIEDLKILTADLV